MADGKVEIQVSLDASEAKKQAASLGKELGNAVQSGAEGAGGTAKAAGKGVGDKLSEGVSEGAAAAASKVEQSLGKKLQESGKNLEKFGDAYSKAVSLPIAAVATASAASAISVDTALTGVRKTLDATEGQYQDLKDSAIEYSKTSPVSAAQLLDIQALGAQLGYSIEELDLFGETVSGLDIATNMNAEEAAMELAQFTNIMGTSHDQVDRYGSTVVDLGNHFATTEADISSMAMRIAGAGKQMGMSEADVLGMATALSSLGIKAEMGGSAISTIMSTIDKEVATNGETLSVWAETAGMSVEEFQQAWGNDVVSTLQTVLSNMGSAVEEGGSMAAMLDDLGIGAIRQTDVLKRLAGSGDMLTRAVDSANTAWEENTALTKEVENRNESMESRLKVLWNQVQAVAIEVGGPLVEALISVLESGQPILDVIANLAQAFADMDSESQKLVLGAAAVVAGFGPISSATGKAEQAVGKLADAFKKNYDAALKTKTGGEQAKKGFDKARSGADGAKKSSNDLKKSNNDLQKALDNSGKKAKESGDKVKKAGDNAKTAAKSTDQMASSSKSAAAASKDVAAQSGAAASGLKNTATQASLGAKALSGVKAAAGLAKTALMTVAPAAVITALATLAAHIMEVNDRAKRVKEGTSAMADALAGVSEKVRETADQTREAGDQIAGSFNSTSFDGYIRGVESVNDAIDDMVERHKEAADGIQEAYSAYSENNGLLEAYMETINELTGKVDENGQKVKLTAEEQAQLAWAVEGVNGVLDTSYAVIDAENGVLDTSTEMLNINAQAWRDRAKAAADQEALKIAMVEQAQAAADQEAAMQKLNEVFQKYGIEADAAKYLSGELSVQQLAESSNVAKNAFEWLNVTTALEDAKKGYETATGVLEDANTSVDILTENTKESASAFLATQSALASWISATGEGKESSEMLAKALRDSDVDLDAFTKALEGVGISTEDLARIMGEEGEQGARALVEAYKGEGDALLEWAKAHGKEVPESYSSGIEDGTPAVEQASASAAGVITQAVANEQGNVSQAAGMLIDAAGNVILEGRDDLGNKTYQVFDEASGKLTEVSPQYAEKARALMGDTATAMGEADPSSGVQAFSDNALGLLSGKGSDFAGVGGQLGTSVGEGAGEADVSTPFTAAVMEAVNALYNLVGAASLAGAAVAGGADSGLSSVDFSPTGTSGGQQWVNAFGGQAGNASAKATAVATGARSSMGKVSFTQTGATGGGQWGTGFGSKAGEAATRAQGVGTAARNRLSAIDFRTPGVTGGNSYGGGIGSTANNARAQAGSVADAAQGGMKKHNGSASTWGSHLGSNFASGIRSAIGWVRDAANNIANAAKSILGFSVPAEGPWSGAEKGGERSGEHLVQNFARGMLDAEDDVRAAARSVADAARDELDGVGSDLAEGIVVDFMDIDPMAQLSASIKGGISVAQMVTAASMVPSVTNNNQTVQFNQPVKSPDEIARTMRMQQRYGLAGRR